MERGVMKLEIPNSEISNIRLNVPEKNRARKSNN